MLTVFLLVIGGMFISCFTLLLAGLALAAGRKAPASPWEAATSGASLGAGPTRQIDTSPEYRIFVHDGRAQPRTITTTVTKSAA